MGGLPAAVGVAAIVREADLAVDGAEVEKHGGLLQMDVLKGGLLLRLEGVEPEEGEGVDVVGVGGDREASFDEAEGLVIGLEEVAAEREGRIGVALDVGAELI